MASSFFKFLKFVYSQWFIKPAYPTQSCEGRNIIITGANIGLGYEAAKHFVRLGAAKVILGVRNIDKGEAVRRSSRETSIATVWWRSGSWTWRDTRA